MIFLMVINLFTSRIILDALGVDDYGIYNVVGGIVAMFTMLSGSLSNAISRFITFELGKNDKEKLKNVFCTGVNIQIGISLIIILIVEIVGIWFLNNKMNIPIDRVLAANWTLQCSLGIFVCNLISVPYNAAIIAHERMNAFAYISILDAILKLIIVYILYIAPIDRLIEYSLLLFAEAVFIRMIYGIYSKRHFEECTYHFIYDKETVKQMTGFAGWNYLGACAGILNTQGVNILMNVYFGVTVNAARGIATQAGAAISQFVNSFTTALNPQITKSYAKGDTDYLLSLVCRGAKFSGFLFLIIAIPLVVEAPMIFKIWLKNVPDYAVLFFRINVLNILMDSVLVNSLMTSVFATGDIKKYQICVTAVGGMVFPLTWVAYALGATPEKTYIIYFLIYCVVLYVRLAIVRQKIGLAISRYLYDVLARIIPVSICGLIIPMAIIYLIPPSFFRIIITGLISVMIIGVAIYFVGLSKNERIIITGKILSTIHLRKS